MIPWEILDRVRVPGTGEELRLSRRGTEYSITVDGRELMNSRMHGSEDALAELGCAPLLGKRRVRVLIGGLGMGFTLAAALKQIGRDGHVDVAELVPAVVEWNEGPLGSLAGHPLRDRRVEVLLDDVVAIVRSAKQEYDAILLDTDNGPDAPIVKGNHRLYGSAGLEAAFAALRPQGVLAIWSAGGGHPPFTQRLRRAGFRAQEVPARARGPKGGARHTVWVAQKP